MIAIAADAREVRRLVPAAGALFIALAILLVRRPHLEIPVAEPEGGRYLQGLVGTKLDWTTAATVLRLHGADGMAGVLRLTLKPHPETGSSLKIWIRQGPHLLAGLERQPGHSTYAVDVSSVRTEGLWLEPEPMRILCSEYAEDEGGRTCAKVMKASFEPTGTTGWRPAVWRASNLAAAFLLVGWVLILMAQALLSGAWRTWVPRVVLLGLASGTLWASATRPWDLAWLLPPIPTFLVAGYALASILAFRGRFGAPAAWRIGSLAALAAAVAIAPDAPEAAAALALLGVVTLAIARLPSPPPRAAPNRLWPVLLVVAIGVATILRSHRLTELPYGVWRDEARHGLVSLRMIEDPSYRPAYVAWTEPNVNMPGFGLYLLSRGVQMFGVGTWSMRPVTALAGLLSVPLLFLVARGFGSPLFAALAAALLAASSWHVWLSRYQFPTVLDPLFALTGVLLALQSSRATGGNKRVLWLLGAGASWGLAAQTYHSGRVAPIVGLALVCFLYGLRRSTIPLVGAAVLGATIVVTPMLVAAAEPEGLSRRVEEVALHSVARRFGQAPVAALDQSILRHLEMFTVQGDGKGRLNLPGRPMLDPWTGFGFLVGLAFLLSGAAERNLVFWLVALAIGLLPSALAADGPHAMRSIGALAPACVLSAIGWSCLSALGRFESRDKWLPAAFGLAIAAAATLSCWQTVFAQMATDPRVWRAAYPAATQMGVYVRRMAGTHPSLTIYLPKDMAEESVIAYLAHGTRYGTYNRRGVYNGAGEMAPPRPGDQFLVRGEREREAGEALVRRLVPGATIALEGSVLPGTNTASFVAFAVPE